eukprot:4789623-Prorocentrum_lima.AAC.2
MATQPDRHEDRKPRPAGASSPSRWGAQRAGYHVSALTCSHLLALIPREKGFYLPRYRGRFRGDQLPASSFQLFSRTYHTR